MKQHRRGAATTAIVAVVALVVVLGGVLFYISDPFHSRVRASYDQLTKWTPENIAANPGGYLDFCEQKTKDAIQALKADEIAVAQNRAKLEGMRDDAKNQVENGEKALQELVPAYRAAGDSASAFPIKWRNHDLDKDAAKRQIASLDRQTETQRTLMLKIEAGLKKLEAQVGKIDEAKGKANEQLAEIATNRQLLNVNKLTDDLKERLVSMKGAIQATVNAASDNTGTVSLAELTAESHTNVDDSAIEKALNKYK
jgi:chromosome segregation ATPase